jgi:hypothetical protein
MKCTIILFNSILSILVFSITSSYSQGGGKHNFPEIFNKIDQKNDWKIVDTLIITEFVGNRGEELLYAIDFDLQNEIHTLFIQNKDSAFVNLSLYEFPEQVSAFGFYSRDKSPSQKFFELGFESYYNNDKFVTWYGEFVLFTRMLDSLENRDKILRQFNAEVIKFLPKSKKNVPILDVLPGKNMVQHSTKYYPNRWFGQDYFDRIYYADYHTSDGYSRIFIIDNISTSKADSNFWKFYTFTEQNEGIIIDTLKVDTDYYVLNDPLWGRTVLAKKNQIIYGILDYRNRRWAEERLSDILEELKKRKIVKPG